MATPNRSQNVPPRGNFAEYPSETRPRYRSGNLSTTSDGNTVAVSECGRWRRSPATTKAASKCKGEGEMTPKHHTPIATRAKMALLEGRRGSHVRVPIPCVYGGFAHARCMLDRMAPRSPLECASRRGQREAGFPTRRNFLENCICPSRGGVGGGEECPVFRRPPWAG